MKNVTRVTRVTHVTFEDCNADLLSVRFSWSCDVFYRYAVMVYASHVSQKVIPIQLGPIVYHLSIHWGAGVCCDCRDCRDWLIARATMTLVRVFCDGLGGMVCACGGVFCATLTCWLLWISGPLSPSTVGVGLRGNYTMLWDDGQSLDSVYRHRPVKRPVVCVRS